MASSRRRKRRTRIIAGIITATVLAGAGAAIGVSALSARESYQPDPNIAAKAEAYASKVASDMKAKDEAAAEARIIKLPFPKDRPLSVFYAGDSLSYGLFVSAAANGFRPQVNTELRKHGLIEEHRATKADEKALFKVGNVQDIPESGVDLAILELGTNDLGTNEVGSRTEPALFRKQYEDLVVKVKRSPGVQIICVGVWGQSGPTISDPYDHEIQNVCREHGGQYVDLTAAYETKGSFGPKDSPSFLGPSDNFHPNDQGHRMIADLILERIRVV